MSPTDSGPSGLRSLEDAQADQTSGDDCKSPTGTIRRVASSEAYGSSMHSASSVFSGMERQSRDQRDDQDGPDKPSYSHVVKSGSTPLAEEDSSATGPARPSTPSNSTYQQHQQHQQHYLTAPPSANSARLSRSASRSRPMPPFTPGFGSRQASFVGGGMKTSRSVSRARRPEGERGDGELSDDDLDYAYKKNRQAHTPLRPTFLKSATIAGPARRELDRDDDDEPLGQDDEIVVRDRGEDLIRKRMRERKKAKRLASASANAAAREARGRDFTTSASSPREGQHDTSFQSFQPERTGLSTSIPSVPHTPALNERQSSIGRGKSTSRARAYPGTSKTVPSTPFGGTSSEANAYEYFPSMKGKGYAGAQSLTSLVPREEDEGESDVPEQASTPTALEPSASNFPTSTSVEGVDWAYLDRPQPARQPRQEERQQAFSMSQYGSRNPSRAESIVSDVISDVVRGDRASAVDGDSRRMSEAGEEEYEEDEGENEEEDEEGELDQEDDEDEDDQDEQGVTMRDRQDAINIEHPFGLPIWKPALYRKSRSITRNAEKALHAIPSAAAERHLLPGNILWTLVFGWWLALLCFALAVLVFIIEFVTSGGIVRTNVTGEVAYARTIAGLGWYLGWPFGKYVEGKGVVRPSDDESADAAEEDTDREDSSENAAQTSHTNGVREANVSMDSSRTVKKHEEPNGNAAEERAANAEDQPLFQQKRRSQHAQAHGVTFGTVTDGQARQSLYGAISTGGSLANGGSFRHKRGTWLSRLMGGTAYWIAFLGFIAPVLGAICLICWGLVVTIPMAKLTWNLLKYLAFRPLEIKFRSAPPVIAVPPTAEDVNDQDGITSDDDDNSEEGSPERSAFRQTRLKAGQLAPTAGPDSTVLLCTYRAIGLQYYKYTVGGVNIMFVNLLPLVFFTIFDGLVLLPAVERAGNRGETINPVLAIVASQALIFILSLASVIPLSYFIGMAVASISAQSSIGMGAVINATFGSIIEIVLYGIALTQGKGKLVEGSIVGSILAGVLLMPGMSMISGAFKRKEQKFNAKSAGVTSTMLIMAIIGTLTPTLFYQTYGSFELRCEGCPDSPPIEVHDSLTSHGHNESWNCERCFYVHPNPAQDPFYQDQVKGLMYICATILVLAYLIGLWFSLRTHASQIWQNPQPLMKLDEVPAGGMHPAHRATVYQRLTPQAVMQQLLPTTTKPQDPIPASAPASNRRATTTWEDQQIKPAPRPSRQPSRTGHAGNPIQAPQRRNASLISTSRTPISQTPRMPTNASQDQLNEVSELQLPKTIAGEAFNTEEFTRAVAVATVNALKSHENAIAREWKQARVPAALVDGAALPAAAAAEEEQGGHEGPSWSRTVSSCVLLGCTVLYAIIAEILVDVVDVVLQGSGIDEKFLGVSLFALVPNTTEFMNAMSFALSGNIALSMEIGSAYALQVCLLQIPAMVAFSAFYDPRNMGEMVDTFTLIFPRWDVISIILSIFLLTYTYIEARSNYHRGSILVLSYLVLAAGFYFAPSTSPEDPGFGILGNAVQTYSRVFETGLSLPQVVWRKMVGS